MSLTVGACVLRDEDMERYGKLGLRNAEIIELTRLHCANAVIEKPVFMGKGMLEPMLGLPLDARTIRCDHAPNPAGAGMQLEGIAFDFWRSNCRGCPHRVPVGLPNLATWGQEELDRQAAEREVADRKRAERDSIRAERSAARMSRVQGEPAAARALVQLLDGIDTEEPDERASELVDQCRATPEKFTSGTVGVLLDTAQDAPNESLLKGLEHLNQHGLVPIQELVKAAVTLLARGVSSEAARIVVDHAELLEASDVSSVVDSALFLAGRSHGPFHESIVHPDLMLLAAERNLPIVLDKLNGHITGADDSLRGYMSSAASELIQAMPEVAPVIARSLVTALRMPRGTEIYAGSPRHGIVTALERALVARPRDVDRIFRDQAKRLDDDQRHVLFDAYERVLRLQSADEEAIDEDLLEVCRDAALDVALGEWGFNARGDGVDTLELLGRYHPEALRSHAAALIGLLISLTQPADDADLGVTLDMPPALQEMQRQSSAIVRQSLAGKVREIFAQASSGNPAEALNVVESLLDQEPSGGGGDGGALRRHAILLVGQLGTAPELASRALSRLVGYALSADVVTRSVAIDSLEALRSAPERNLPDDVLELLPAWLRDQYVGPHQAAIRAMRRGWPVLPHVRVDVVLALLGLAQYYATTDARLLNDILDLVWGQSGHFEADARDKIRHRCLELAEQLSIYDLENFVRWRGKGELSDGSTDLLADRILDCLLDLERATDTNRRDDDLVRMLRDFPPKLIVDRVERVREAARIRITYVLGQSLEYVEVLQCAGLWSEAVALAAEIEDGVPDTIESRGARALASVTKHGAEVEFFLSRGDMTGAAVAMDKWKKCAEIRDEVLAQRQMPWEIGE